LTESMAIELAKNAMTMILMISAPMLMFGLIVGLLVSIFQAATQINEFTLAFVPKILAVMAAGALFGPWILNNMVTYTSSLFEQLPNLVR
jgi:flagellar biosynthesis protein FliQ